jgi:hypothetical protein
VATRNVPNNIFDSVNWYVLDDLREKLNKLHSVENHEDLNRVDSKAKKLNQRYKKAAVKEVEAVFNNEIVRIAGLITANKFKKNSSLLQEGETYDGESHVAFTEEETKLTPEELTRKSVEKIVQDFRVSLVKALDALGMASNVERHVNELIHRANFRFSDLQTLLKKAKTELTKCL